MMERSEDIMTRKEEACVKCNDVKEENKTERFDKFMVARDKKIKLQEKVDAKMLTIKMSDLDPDGQTLCSVS